MTRGRFISLEGGDGAGKSTQVRALMANLAQRGIEAIMTRESGGSPGAEKIRGIILANDTQWSARTEAFLFAASRADHVEKVIEPALRRGAWVLCDRYIDSSRAYQGMAGGLGDEHVMTLHALGAVLMPDRTIVLDLGHQEGTARTRIRDGDETDPIGAREAAYHARVENAYRGFVEKDPRRMRLVDAKGDRDAVAARIMTQIEDMLG